MSAMKMSQIDPIIALWPYMSSDLQTRLLGVHQRHNKLSVKKVIGSLRGGSVIIAQTLRIIGESSEIPAKSDSSTPALESTAVRVTTSRPRFKCSQYVTHACEVLLEKCKATAYPLTASKEQLSCEDFFLTLIEAGPSPLLLQWQEDGFDAARIKGIFEKLKSERKHEKLMKETNSKSHACGAAVKLAPSSHSDVQGLIDLTHAGLSLGQEDVDVFISYGREQRSTSLAVSLKGDLETEGFSVWLDVTDISSGSDWHSAIGEGLRKCKAIIAIITHKYIHSKYCKNELFMADSLQKHIFPIFLEEVKFDSPDDAGVQFVVGSVNWIMMTPDTSTYSRAFTQLLDGMTKKGIAPSNAVSSVHASHNYSEVSNRKKLDCSLSKTHTGDEDDKITVTTKSEFKRLL